MSKGDYVKVTYRTGVGVADVEIIARGDGSKVDWDEPRDKDRFVKVEVQKRNGEASEKHLFAAIDVVAILQGHKTAAQMASKPRPKRTRVTHIAADGGVDLAETGDPAE